MAYNNVKVKERQVMPSAQQERVVSQAPAKARSATPIVYERRIISLPKAVSAAQAAQMQPLGVVSEVPMNGWNVAISYEKLNVVTYKGGTFLAKRASIGVAPLEGENWQEIWMPILSGVGVASSVVEYAIGYIFSNTPPQDGWSTNIPKLDTGQYLWTRTTITFTDGEKTVLYTTGVPIAPTRTSELENDGDGTSPFTTRNFVNSSINALAAFFITPTAAGNTAWASKAALLAATTFYSGGKTRVPTQNDYAIVQADESQPKGADGSYPTTRYSYQGGTYPNGQWDFQYIVNSTTLTDAQIAAINSGITKGRLEEDESHIDAAANMATVAAAAAGDAGDKAIAAGNAASAAAAAAEKAQAAVEAESTRAQQAESENQKLAQAGVAAAATAQKAADEAKQAIAAETERAQKAESVNAQAAAAASETANKAGSVATGALALAGVAVRYNEDQSLSAAQQAQARKNIGAGTGSSDFNGDYNSLTNKPKAVLYSAQSLTEDEKAQARSNIGAGDSQFSGDYNDLKNKPNIPSAYTLKLATPTELGGIKIGASVTGKDYAVKLNDNGQAYVSVPWTDNDTKYSQATASTLGLVKIGATGLAEKNYPIQLNANGQMYVSVPWTDTQSDLSSYAKKTDLNAYLPKTGGTVTGGLTVNGVLKGASYFVLDVNNASSYNEGLRINSDTGWAIVGLGNAKGTTEGEVHPSDSIHAYGIARPNNEDCLVLYQQGNQTTDSKRVRINNDGTLYMQGKKVAVEEQVQAAQTRANASVRYDIEQGLTAEQQAQARSNIGAGASSFSGSYNDLSNKPDLSVYMPKSGGQFTGDISVSGGGSINTKGYVTGTWLATTNATDLGTKPERIAVIGTQGTANNYIYYRTPAEILGDIGAGTYTKPSGGIPATDLASSVQTSLGKADTALQSVPTATSSVLGLVKLGTDTVQSATANTPTSASGRTYPVQKNTAGQAVVNVPWESGASTSDLLDKVYPVGSIYLSITNASPASFLGGIWARLPENYVLEVVYMTKAGITLPAGLPDISGSIGGTEGGLIGSPTNATGCFTTGSSYAGPGGTTWRMSALNFIASAANSIYGKSSTVQPPAYGILAWRRVQ